MATAGAILQLLEAEVREVIGAIKPETKSDTLFSTSKVQNETDVESVTGRERWFEIEWIGIKQLPFGTTERYYTVTANISIGYPAHGWDLDMVSDYDQIERALRTGNGGGASAVSGVSFRLLNDDEEPEAVELDDWKWYKLPLIAEIQTTA